MESAYIITAVSVIAVAAIYYVCVRKMSTQAKLPQSAREPREIQQ